MNPNENNINPIRKINTELQDYKRKDLLKKIGKR